MAMYLDLHAHASKRGCFIYGNVLDCEQQVQNQLYCKLIAMNTAHFDYEGCLFSRDHMQRVDPGDRSSGLTAEGSGRVSTYLSHKLVHSYTLECNYNCSKFQNEVAATEGPCRGKNVNQPSAFATTSERFTPSIWEGVGRASMVSMLDLRGHNPCSRLPMTRVKTLERVRLAVMGEVRQKAEYRGTQASGMASRHRRTTTGGASGNGNSNAEEIPWVHRTDAVFVPTPKVETVSLPKVQQAADAPRAKRLPKERVVSKAESLKMKQAAISLPAHIDAYTSNAASAVQYPTQQPLQPQQPQQPKQQPQAPASAGTSATPNGPQSLKYKRYFNSKESSHITKESSSNMRRGSGKSSLLISSVPPPEQQKSKSQATVQAGLVKQLDGIYALPLSPPIDTNNGVTSSDSQQSISIQAPQLVFQAPSPPNISDLSIQQEKTAMPLSEKSHLNPVSQSNNAKSKAESMLSSTDSKEFLPENIMQIYKPHKDRVSNIPTRVRSARREKQSVLASNE